MRLEDLSNEQLGAHVRDRHTRLRAAFNDGLTAHDCDETFNHQSRILRALRGNTGQAKEIELNGTSEQEQALGQDDPPAGPGLPRVERPGMTAVDSAVLEELAIRRSGSSNPEEDIRQARLRRNGSSPASVRAMAESIPGYGRLK